MNESKNQEFIQGLEKLIETLRGKEYSALIIADAMSNDKVETMCAEFEDIYSQLAPFKTSSQTVNTQSSVAKSLSTTNGESIQPNYENRAVKTLLDSIDEQIKRMRSCEDFGMFDTCAYLVSKDYDVVIAAASVFKSLTRGENSSVESSAVNVWKDKEDVGYIKDYLMRFYHPEFLSVIDKDHHYPTTATMLVSGKEMAY